MSLINAGGLPAELSGDVSGSYAAAWSRFGIAIRNLELLVERTAANGDLKVTCWAGLAPIVPDASFAWAVA